MNVEYSFRVSDTKFLEKANTFMIDSSSKETKLTKKNFTDQKN